MKSRSIWIFGAIGLWLLPAPVLLAQSFQLSKPTAGTDFIEYWAASYLLLTGGNPYSPGQLGDVQSSVTARATVPLIMWNPPWTLFFILPFGALSFTASQFLWLLLHVFLILFSAQTLWRIYGDTAESSYTPWLLAFTFIPTSFCFDAWTDHSAHLGRVNIFSLLREKTKWVGRGRFCSTDLGKAAALLSVLAIAVVLGLAAPVVADYFRRVHRRFSGCSNPRVVQSGDLLLLYHLVYD